MTTTAWSWLLFAVSAFGLWLTGRHLRAGWWFAIINQVAVWGPYAIITHQPGLVANSAVFVLIYANNLRKWRHSAATPKTAAASDQRPAACVGAGDRT